ncbi:MAG TPA: hypothetical protein VHC22_10265 [Pirellulales bacterium]|nr:hypothetical protein [Pirellulales bacterium]
MMCRLCSAAPLALIIGFYFARFGRGDGDSLRDAAAKRLTKNEPTANNINAIALIRNFLGGVLVVLRYTGAKGECEKYVYLTDDEEIIYDDMESVGMLLKSYRQPTWWGLFLSVTTFGGIIAVAICVTLCVVVMRNPGLKDPAPVLSNAFTTVLGFYFGTQAREAERIK